MCCKMHLMKYVVEVQVPWPLSLKPRSPIGNGVIDSLCRLYMFYELVNINTLPKNKQKNPEFLSYAFPSEVYKSKLVSFPVV